MKKLIVTLVVIAIILIIFLAVGPLFIIEEGQQAVVTRFGRITGAYTEAGLHFKMPVVDRVVRYSKRILSWDGDPQRVPTKENQFIWVDTTARWEITDPQLFYEAVNTVSEGYGRLDEVIDSSVRTVIAKNELPEAVRNSNIINELDRTEVIQQQSTAELDSEGIEDLRNMTATSTEYQEVSKGREQLSQNMLKAAKEVTPQFGIKLIDIVIRQIRYSDDLTESVYNRMIKERNQIAEAFRSYGQGKKAEWLGKLENEQKAILSRAYQKSETIKGQADAEATSIYADAYSVDPGFFEFWRAMESYRRSMPQFKKTLSTDMEYFNYLYNQTGR
ncbi:MAG: protease modulator HflC [Spirochaetales bacterium]|nr:protease modulator HflC [Spirochaetales bacterium]MCF7937862.1 protease modulator HflC [Spirochaetales bacterium]